MLFMLLKSLKKIILPVLIILKNLQVQLKENYKVEVNKAYDVLKKSAEIEDNRAVFY